METPNDKYALHAIVIKNTVPRQEAQRIAWDIMGSKRHKFVRETKSSYRFRHIPKTKFEPRSFRTQVVNDDISIIYGKIKSGLEGAGMFDYFKKQYERIKAYVTNAAEKLKKTVGVDVSEAFKPRLDSFNNRSQATLDEYGNRTIKSLMLYRTPIGGMINTALNLVSLGKWNELRKKYGFDRLFHLALVANVGGKNIIIEKNEVINISTNYKTYDTTETEVVPLGERHLTVDEMLKKARETVGDVTFFSYDAFNNNCQFFIKYCLEAVDLYSDSARDFLFQDLGELVKELPGYVSKVANAATDTGAVFNKISGQGKSDGAVLEDVKATYSKLKSKTATESFYEYVKKTLKEKPVELMLIQQLYPKWAKTKEAKELLGLSEGSPEPPAPPPSPPPPGSAKNEVVYPEVIELEDSSPILIITELPPDNKKPGVPTIPADELPPSPPPIDRKLIIEKLDEIIKKNRIRKFLTGAVLNLRERKAKAAAEKKIKEFLQQATLSRKEKQEKAEAERKLKELQAKEEAERLKAEQAAMAKEDKDTPAPATPLFDPTIADIKAFLVNLANMGDAKDKKTVAYYPNSVVAPILLLTLLRKYNNDCLLVGYADEKHRFYGALDFFNQKSSKYNVAEPSVPDSFYEEFKNCIKRGTKLIAIPIGIRLPGNEGHANVLMYRVDINQLERYEPHGVQGFFAKDSAKNTKYNERIDEVVQKFFSAKATKADKKKGIAERLGDIVTAEGLPTFKYLSPMHLHKSYIRGFQAYESAQHATRYPGKESLYEGLCQVWSSFYIQLCFKYPTMTGEYLIEQTIKQFDDKKAIGSGAYFRVALGYLDEVEKEIDSMLKRADAKIPEELKGKTFTWKDFKASFSKLDAKSIADGTVESTAELKALDEFKYLIGRWFDSEVRALHGTQRAEREAAKKPKNEVVGGVSITKKAFVKEHNNLIGVLQRGKTPELLAEAKDQSKELAKVLKGGKQAAKCYCSRSGGRARCACSGSGDCDCKLSGGAVACMCR